MAASNLGICVISGSGIHRDDSLTVGSIRPDRYPAYFAVAASAAGAET